ncbi:flagellar hook-length control protein FliK [Microvirga sp. VF16]|uniref:flagellar hook-length control protein FliK n=1 Tax=Microvirga sp. VF16 TaxID=2807101 RepID=UPI00193CF8E1|nr:flagellar hook-length control protein FliK [Microvirga sp. VF16]QRM30139.1 flagellar hook-length control protein FliK [Microvirga sp. VF16]
MDTQSRNASVNSDAQENSGNAATSDFGSLLDGFSGRSQKEGVGASQQETILLGSEADKVSPELDGAEIDPLQALLPDVTPSDGSAGTLALQSGSPVLSILENLLPRILARTGNGGNADAGQSGASLASANLAMPQQRVDELSPANSGLGSKLAVSVQNQETHFRPIVEGLSISSTESGATVPDEGTGPTTETLLPVKPKGAEMKSQLAGNGDGLNQALTDMTAEAEAAKRSEEEGIVKDVSLDRASGRAELQKQSPVGGSKSETASLPPSTLQHLAKSIIEDVRGLTEPQQPSFQQDGLNRVATARASAGVLRVLDLQLKPAELGLVTIRMRLAGDGIEMEIQAQNEDTAELLRNDAEKLSSLLRVSGYRPDAINIQSTEAASHDRSSFQRPQQGTQSQGQAFDQGAAAGQGNSSRHQDERYGRGGSELRRDGKESLPPGGSRTGGIYL